MLGARNYVANSCAFGVFKILASLMYVNVDPHCL